MGSFATFAADSCVRLYVCSFNVASGLLYRLCEHRLYHHMVFFVGHFVCADKFESLCWQQELSRTVNLNGTPVVPSHRPPVSPSTSLSNFTHQVAVLTSSPTCVNYYSIILVFVQWVQITCGGRCEVLTIHSMLAVGWYAFMFNSPKY